MLTRSPLAGIWLRGGEGSRNPVCLLEDSVSPEGKECERELWNRRELGDGVKAPDA